MVTIRKIIVLIFFRELIRKLSQNVNFKKNPLKMLVNDENVSHFLKRIDDTYLKLLFNLENYVSTSAKKQMRDVIYGREGLINLKIELFQISQKKSR